MLTINEMLVLKKEYGLSYEYIAEKSGVPLSTVQKVFGKTTGTPRRTTIEALSRAFCKQEADFLTGSSTYGSYGNREETVNPAGSGVCEEEYQYGTTAHKMNENRGKTIEDYLRLPEGIRVELIDGAFFDLAAPTTIHQKISAYINIELEKYIESNNGECVAFIAPTDVQLDCDNKTMVQPDVLVVCDRDKITRARIVGAPDFIVEVLSESNWYHDVVRKKKKYRAAGVREYWVVIPEQRTVLVYIFDKGDEAAEYTFQDKIPVSIWEGKCLVDFAVLNEKLSFLWGK